MNVFPARRWPIRTRLTAWYAASLTVLIALFGLLIDGLMHERLLSRTDFELDEELHELALEVEIARDRDDLERQLELRFGSHKSFEFVVQTPTGECIFASRHVTDVNEALLLTRAGESIAFRSVSLRGLEGCRVGTQRVSGSEGPLSIAVVMPLEPSLAELHDLRRLLLTVGPLIVLVAIGGGYWLARRSLRPIDLMTSAAARITAQRTGERLEVSNPDDELGRLGTTLNGMIDRLQRALDDMRQFTADAAHELRTPLAVIRSTAEIALRSPRPSDYYEDCLQTVVDEAERLAALSNQLLILAREDAGLHAEPPSPVDLAEIVRDAAADIEPLAEQKRLSLSCACDDAAIIFGNRDRLRRVFVNLLDNAIKYTLPGGAIAVTLESRNGEAEATVRDTGIGIAPEHLPHVCERFYRADASHSRETGGTGLGLAICRAIVSSHHGRLILSSRPGEGTEARIILPQRSHANAVSDRRTIEAVAGPA